MGNLANRNCAPYHEGTPRLVGDEIQRYLSELKEWTVVDEHHLKKNYTFADFVQTLDFINRVGHLAEAQNHHPDICFGWGKAEITIWTHAANGLSESDFILAAKIDTL